MSFDPAVPTFWEHAALRKELLRVYEICNGCRRCFNLCPSFDVLFKRIDAEEVDGDVERLSEADHARVVDLCYDCKLCYNHCPYNPPHHYDIDFPRLMVRAKAQSIRQRGLPIRDRLMVHTDLVGRWGSRLAPLVNWANRQPWLRSLLHRTAGIHKEKLLPTFHRETFERWFARRAKTRPAGAGRNGKVAFFATCLVNYHFPEIGRAAVEVLEHNGVEVVVPPQRCCGFPFFDVGLIEKAQRQAAENLAAYRPLVEAGYDLVAPVPTCSLTWKREYELLLSPEQARPVAARTFDLSEYLMRLHAEGKLSTAFTGHGGKIAYQIPCHLRDQNIGYKSRDLMQLVPGNRISLIERCSAHDGIWSMKTDYFDLAMQWGKKLFQAVEQAETETVATDCPLAGRQIVQATGRRPLHPVEVLHRAYGLSLHHPSPPAQGGEDRGEGESL